MECFENRGDARNGRKHGRAGGLGRGVRRAWAAHVLCNPFLQQSIPGLNNPMPHHAACTRQPAPVLPLATIPHPAGAADRDAAPAAQPRRVQGRCAAHPRRKDPSGKVAAEQGSSRRRRGCGRRALGMLPPGPKSSACRRAGAGCLERCTTSEQCAHFLRADPSWGFAT